MIDRVMIGEQVARLLDSLDESPDERELEVQRVMVLVELGDDEGSLVRLQCSDEEATGQAGILTRGIVTALFPADEGDP